MNSQLNTFNPNTFDKQAGVLKRMLWHYIHILFFESAWMPIMCIKLFLLRLFGAKIGKGLVIKPSVRIKFPWKLEIGDYVWLGEGCWLDNLDCIKIGNNVCISQGALLLTGNHDYSISSFDYRNAPITLENGVWIGARTVVCPGVVCKNHSILTVGSIATKDMDAFLIYQGNPAQPLRKRIIKS